MTEQSLTTDAIFLTLFVNPSSPISAFSKEIERASRKVALEELSWDGSEPTRHELLSMTREFCAMYVLESEDSPLSDDEKKSVLRVCRSAVELALALSA